MQIRCPSCRKRNKDADICVRCSCDLSQLRRLLATAGQHTRLALAALKRGSGAEALDHCEAAWELKQDKQTARIAFLSAVSARQLDNARLWRQRIDAA